jgi:cyclophilin family peptidyl-prolyl cis-trans isomerase
MGGDRRHHRRHRPDPREHRGLTGARCVGLVPGPADEPHPSIPSPIELSHTEERMTSVTISTEKGDIDVDLFTTDAPKATKNFVDLAKKGFYDDVVFHRVIPGFVAQAGDGQHGKKATLNAGRVGTGGPGYTFEDEPVKGDYVRGSLAMANAGPNTNGSQFFICHQDLTGRLPKNYTLFGQVTKGMDVVDAIVSAPRNSRDLPDDPVAITGITVHDD